MHYGSTATEQIEIFRKSEANLQDFINTKYSDIELQIQRFTKDILEHTTQQYKIFETNRNEIIQQQREIQKALAVDIQNFCGQTQENLCKVQESLRYKVQRSTNNIITSYINFYPYFHPHHPHCQDRGFIYHTVATPGRQRHIRNAKRDRTFSGVSEDKPTQSQQMLQKLWQKVKMPSH